MSGKLEIIEDAKDGVENKPKPRADMESRLQKLKDSPEFFGKDRASKRKSEVTNQKLLAYKDK